MKLAIIYLTFVQSQVKISGPESSDFGTNKFLREFLQKSMQNSLLHFLDKVSLAFIIWIWNHRFLIQLSIFTIFKILILLIVINIIDLSNFIFQYKITYFSKDCERRRITTIINWWVLTLIQQIMAYWQISWLPEIKIIFEKITDRGWNHDDPFICVL